MNKQPQTTDNGFHFDESIRWPIRKLALRLSVLMRAFSIAKRSHRTSFESGDSLCVGDRDRVWCENPSWTALIIQKSRGNFVNSRKTFAVNPLPIIISSRGICFESVHSTPQPPFVFVKINKHSNSPIETINFRLAASGKTSRNVNAEPSCNATTKAM